MLTVGAGQVRDHLNVLTRDIGVRGAGFRGERQAADYIASVFESCGAKVTVESFPVRERAVTSETLDLLIRGAWHRHPCSLLSHAPGTAGRRPAGRRSRLIDAATGYQRDDLSALSGKAVIHLGTHIESPDDYRRLMAGVPRSSCSSTRAIRQTRSRPTAFPAYVHRFGAVPTVSMVYQDAWNGYAAGASAARLCAAGGMRDSTSQNVVAELAGSDQSAGVVYVGAHHDTQAGSVGADDNGSGVAAVLPSLPRSGECPARRTIRLVSFGAEEQLSVGSATYVRRHRDELAAHGRVMLNFDAFGSLLGWNYLVCNGPEAMGHFFVRHLAAADLDGARRTRR